MTLNDRQLEGVRATEGPVLILAGAGSGKTRVLTERIAYLISEKKVSPFNIMAITFTNKAAAEMKERVNGIAGNSRGVWVSTFHSSCVRILREHGEKLGFSSGFSIYDTDDSKAAMKEVLKRLDIDAKKFPEKTFLARISSAKDKLQGPDFFQESSRDPLERQMSRVYKGYQDRLREQNAMDFDDLIVNTVTLFKRFPEVLSAYQERFKYIMVDEYQDTNTAQFELIRLLAAAHRNLCVVGDDDQSIYKFRGANILNILNFEGTYPEAKVIKLEENYRSTSQILNAANAVIGNNKGRRDKRLWTGNPDGDKILFKRLDSGFEEAQYIAEDISKKVKSGEYNYSDCAILYRTNAQSRTLEEKLLMENIPYRIVGGTNFYQRKEIKDALCYLKTIDNGRDDISVLRILNVPRRGIGDTTVERVMGFAAVNAISFYEALTRIEEIPQASKAAGKIKDFVKFIEGYKNTARETDVPVLLEDVLNESGYLDMLSTQGTDEAKARLENLGELISKAVSYQEEHENPTLTGFLEEVALIADIDNVTEENERVLLMTLHSAKGLEFPNVYMAGMEEGLFPGIRTINSGDDEEMEEERRLAYVGITRAKRHLTMTSALRRMVMGETQNHSVSRFVKEIPGEMLEGDSPNKKENPFGQDYDSPFENHHDTGYFKSTSYGRRGSPEAPKVYKPKIDPAVMGAKIQKSPLDYAEGDRVSHIKFGQGTVMSIKDGGRDYEVSVEFDTAGVRKMFASFAKLKKV